MSVAGITESVEGATTALVEINGEITAGKTKVEGL
jgi:hypothetical protein